MKRNGVVILFVVLAVSLSGCVSGQDNLNINKKTFPDENIREYVKSLDSDYNGKLSVSEREGVTSLVLSDVCDLTGLESFPNLESIEIQNCWIASEADFGNISKLKDLSIIGSHYVEKINLSRNDNLETFIYYDNSSYGLEELNLPSQSKSLKKIQIGNSKLTDLNLSGFECLEEVDLSFDELTGVKVSDCPNLEKLSCYVNDKLSTLEINNCPKLSDLNCGKCSLTSLDLSGCPNLTILYCENNKLTSLDLSKTQELSFVNCSENEISALDLSACTKLTGLHCGENKLSALDVSCCPDLDSIECIGNELTGLKIGTNENLTLILCYNNKLSDLDVSGCPNLERLLCGDNNLNSLDISKCPKLINLVESVEPKTYEKINNIAYDSDDGRGLYFDPDVDLKK